MTTESTTPPEDAASRGPALSPEGTIAADAQFDQGKTLWIKDGYLKLGLTLMLGNLATSAMWGAITKIFLPVQAQQMGGEADKVTYLALITTLGAVAAMVSQPIAGFVSDRTRSRFGRRAPWMIIGSLAGVVALVGMATSDSIVQLVVSWVLVQFLFNIAGGPMSAIMPDRVPSSIRGTFSSMLGGAGLIGGIGGEIAAIALTKNITIGYLTFAAIVLLAIVLIVTLNPDRSNAGESKPPLQMKQVLSTFWVNPIAHPDFFFGFTGRLLLVMGLSLVSSMSLYLAQDYLGLSHEDALKLIPVSGLIAGATSTLSLLVSGPLSDKIGRRKPIVLIAGLFAVVAFIFPWIWPTVPGMLIMNALVGLGMGTYLSVDQALMTEVLPSKTDYGKDLGVVNIGIMLPQTFAPALAGFIINELGGYATLFPLAIVISLVGSVVVLGIRTVR